MRLQGKVTATRTVWERLDYGAPANTMNGHQTKGEEMTIAATTTATRTHRGRRFTILTMTVLLLGTLYGDGEAATEAPSAAPNLNGGLVGHWTFDDGRGSIASDVSGGGNHGTIRGGAQWTKGVIGGALEFDGTDDFVTIPNERHFDITGSVTVSAWIRVESFAKAWQAIVTKGDRAWRLHRASNRNSVGFACSDLARGQVGDLLGTGDVTDGKWHHVAGILDETTMSLFVDGVIDTSMPASPNISVNDHAVLIGANAQVRGRLFHGLIDDVRIYDRALSIKELRALAKAGGMTTPGKAMATARTPATAPPSPPPSLAGEFKKIFNGDSLTGWNAQDLSYWTVRDGAITGESSDQHPCSKNQFMVWQGGDVSDFELQLKFRVQGNGCNSGVQFRSRMREDGLAIGYQADIYQSGGYLGGVCDELHQRNGPELLSANGSKTLIAKDGKRTRVKIDTRATLRKWPLWNDYHIIAKGHQMILRINGVTASELIDNEEGHHDLTGILGLQLRAGKPMTVQFRDIYLKQ